MRVTVHLDGKWKNRVEGLCSNFDDNSRNEFLDFETGKIALTANEFGKLYKMIDSCPDVDDNVTEPCHVSLGHKEKVKMFGMAYLLNTRIVRYTLAAAIVRRTSRNASSGLCLNV
jgi:hypothetical protein